MKNAKKSLGIVALIIALSAGFGLLFNQTTQKAIAASAPPAVVILNSFDFYYLRSQSSAGAPTFPEEYSLAQALADLLAAGFRIEHVEGETYTLVK